MTKTNASLDLEWNTVIGRVSSKGTLTGSSATTATDSGQAWGTTQHVGGTVVAAPASGGLVYGYILSHTATVLTVDRWYDAAAPGGAAGTTPSTTGQYVIMPQSLPSMFMGLTANATAVAAGDTVLPSEITTVGGGLIRKLATLAHTASASTGTVAATFTVNGTDAIPVTVAKEGIGPSLLATAFNLLQTIITPSTATLSAIGDQLTITDTITL